MELYKGNLKKLEELEILERDDGENKNRYKMTEDKFLAMDFLERSNPGRYKTMFYSLRNNPLTSAENYPNTLTE